MSETVSGLVSLYSQIILFSRPESNYWLGSVPVIKFINPGLSEDGSTLLGCPGESVVKPMCSYIESLTCYRTSRYMLSAICI